MFVITEAFNIRSGKPSKSQKASYGRVITLSFTKNDMKTNEFA